MKTQTRCVWSKLVGVLLALGVGVLFFASASAQETSTELQTRIGYLRASPPATAAGQSATLLPDGRWLLLGGEDADGKPTRAAIVVDAASGKSTNTNPMLTPRIEHTATLLPDGTVLVIGGFGEGDRVIAEPEAFNPKALAFHALSNLDLLPRAMHTATLLTDGRLLIAGGIGADEAVLDDVEIVDTFSGTVERFDAKLETARFGHLATLLPSAPALISGGVGSDNRPVQGSEIFDPATGRFAALPPSSALIPGAGDELASPSVAEVNPKDGAKNVSVDEPISVRFSKPLRVDTLNETTVTLLGPTGPAAVEVVPAEAGMLLFVTPKAELAPSSHYTFFINGASDAVGHALPFMATGFVTGAVGATATPGSNLSAQAAQSTQATGPAKPQPSPPGQDDDPWSPGLDKLHGRWTVDLPDPARGPALQLAPDGVTAVAAEVRRLDGHPLSGVTLRIGTIETTTDKDGQFLLRDIPPGGQVLQIDGRTANHGQTAYGLYTVHVEVQGGQTNVLPYTIWMSRLDPKGYVSLPSPTVTETVVTTAAIPGLELHIPAGTVIRDADGKIVTEINITAIPTDRPPFPLPDFSVPTYFTIQPGGAWLQATSAGAAKGARLIYPNYANEVPNAPAGFWNYDARDKGWYVYGMGKVSADGQQVVPDPGVVIYEFSGAMINNDPPPPPGPKPCDDPCSCGPGDPPPPGGGDGDGDWSKDDDGGNSGCDGGGDPVSLSTGQFTHTERDLWLPDVMPLDIKRTYRALDLNVRSFGIGMSHPYNMFLWSAQQYQEVDLILPSGSRVHYVRTSPGTGISDAVFATQAPGQWAGSTITLDAHRTGWNLVFRDGRSWLFGELAPLQEMTDRNGNKITITHQNGQSGPVTRVDSANGRWVAFTINAAGLVGAATDNAGRTFTYLYDASNQLTSVTDPLQGTRYYTWNAAHRLESIKDPKGNVIVQNLYDANARISRQTEADTSQFTYVYTVNSGKVTQTDVTDRGGNVRRVVFDTNGFIVRDTFPVGRPEEQITTFNVDPVTGWRLGKTDALGRVTTYTYDTLGNRTSVKLLSGTAQEVTTYFTYTADYNAVETITDPLGHITHFYYGNKGNLTSITDANGNTRGFGYDGLGRITSVADGFGHTTTFEYDGADLLSVTDRLGRKTSLFADAVGRFESIRDPLNSLWVTTYDSLNRKTGDWRCVALATW